MPVGELGYEGFNGSKSAGSRCARAGSSTIEEVAPEPHRPYRENASNGGRNVGCFAEGYLGSIASLVSDEFTRRAVAMFQFQTLCSSSSGVPQERDRGLGGGRSTCRDAIRAACTIGGYPYYCILPVTIPGEVKATDGYQVVTQAIAPDTEGGTGIEAGTGIASRMVYSRVSPGQIPGPRETHPQGDTDSLEWID